MSRLPLDKPDTRSFEHCNSPRIRGNGSAIFVHLAREGYTPTEGCVALSRRDLLAVLAEIKSGTTVLITR